jgi:hypothetical protein
MLQVQPAPVTPSRVVGFDTITKLTYAMATQLASAGLSFAARYVGLGPAGPEDLELGEVAALTDAGLGVMAVQYARTKGWSAEAGRADGEAAARNALAAGILPEATLWCDLEGRLPGADVAVAYATQWYEGARNAGIDDPGLYVGAGVPLTSEQLFHELPFRRYWRSFSQVPNVDVRGYQLLQLYPDDITVAGVRVDLDVVQSDYLRNRPVWVIRGDSQSG